MRNNMNNDNTTLTIKFGSYATKNVTFEYWPHTGYNQVVGWGKTQSTSRKYIPLRILRSGIKAFCHENGIEFGSSHAKAQAQYLAVVRNRGLVKKTHKRSGISAL
jgi:hypothetical protein